MAQCCREIDEPVDCSSSELLLKLWQKELQADVHVILDTASLDSVKLILVGTNIRKLKTALDKDFLQQVL